MKQKITKTHTSDFIEWNAANGLVNRLMKDGNYVMAALITCGIYFGLRISDLRKLTWAMVLNDEDDCFNIREEKTNKVRTVKVNANAKQLLTDCYNGLDCPAMSQHCFISKKKQVFSTQRLNVLLKDIRDRGITSSARISLVTASERRLEEQSLRRLVRMVRGKWHLLSCNPCSVTLHLRLLRFTLVSNKKRYSNAMIC